MLPPQKAPPGPTPTTQEKPENNEAAPLTYDPSLQRFGGFVAGVCLGIVPFAPTFAHMAMDAGLLGKGTPEAREGLMRGEMVGGIVGLLFGSGRGPSSAPISPAQPSALSLGNAVPLTVIPNLLVVAVQSGAMVNTATAAGEMGAALSEGGASEGSSGETRELPINSQKQAGHIKGTPQNHNRVSHGKPTSTFIDPAEADRLTREAWTNGQPIGSQGNLRIQEFGRPVGIGPGGGGYQTQVRVSIDASGKIHGTPYGPIYYGPLPQ